MSWVRSDSKVVKSRCTFKAANAEVGPWIDSFLYLSRTASTDLESARRLELNPLLHSSEMDRHVCFLDQGRTRGGQVGMAVM